MQDEDVTMGAAGAAPEPDDAVLVARARAGELAAFDELVRRHHARLYRVVYPMVNRREDAEDLLQEIFLKAWQSLGRFRGAARFSTWLHSIAVNHTLNYLKRRARRPTDSLDDPDHPAARAAELAAQRPGQNPAHQAEVSDLQKKLNAALGRLSDKHRMVVVLHDIQGLRHEEIARLMNSNVPTVRTRLFYARRHLQRELAEFVS